MTPFGNHNNDSSALCNAILKCRQIIQWHMAENSHASIELLITQSLSIHNISWKWTSTWYVFLLSNIRINFVFNPYKITDLSILASIKVVNF